MSIAASQKRTFLRLLTSVRPFWRRDPALPARIQALIAGNRRFGSRDRRLYRELIYTALRHLPWIEPVLDESPDEAVRRVAWLAAAAPATQPFRAAFATGEPPAGDKADLLPAWFREHCPEIYSGAELDIQLQRAPLWLRLQTGPGVVLQEFDSREWKWRRSSVLPDAIELLTEADLTRSQAWQLGRVEIQDLGSQLVLAAAGVAPGGAWLDACAGAGGKSLQLSRMLGPAGRIDAHDTRRGALAELQARATRAGIHCEMQDDRPAGGGPSKPSGISNLFAGIRICPRLPSGEYDGVLVDAPCSGSGTWRRAPHLKWVTTGADVDRAAAGQLALLREISGCVRPGGRLVYATCSLSRRENEQVVAAFLAGHPAFETAAFVETFGFSVRGGGVTILPARHNTDGFFVAVLRRK